MRLPVPSQGTGQHMRKSGEAFRKNGWIDTQLWVREWRRLHPHKATAIVADRLGAPMKTVEKWFAGGSSPSLTWVGAIMAEYGPAFVAKGFARPPSWLSDAARLERRRQLAAEAAAIDAEFCDLEFEGADA